MFIAKIRDPRDSTTTRQGRHACAYRHDAHANPLPRGRPARFVRQDDSTRIVTSLERPFGIVVHARKSTCSELAIAGTLQELVMLDPEMVKLRREEHCRRGDTRDILLDMNPRETGRRGTLA